MQKICIMGLGYIGLPTAIIAAEHGFDVVGFDIDAHRVDRINNYDPVIQEPESIERLQPLIASGAFRATTVLEPADCFLVAVPTPFKEEKKADISYVMAATDAIAAVLKHHDVVIVESTVPVGTTDMCAEVLEKKTGLKAGQDFFVAHCPERVLPGKIFYELVNNPRIIGGINHASVNQAKKFYKQFVKGQLYLTNATTAEMVKLVENSSRDVAIAFANQVASMAYAMRLDPFEVIALANKHPRVTILNPSCGVGGHCIAVDPWFLVETFPEQSQLLQSARIVNDTKPLQVVSLTRSWIQEWQERNEGIPTVLVLGLTYKADVDDMRESPALAIAQKLQKYSDINLLVAEPNVAQTTLETLFNDAVVSLQEGIDRADIIICLVPHKQFKDIDHSFIRTKKVLDFCGLMYKPHVENDEQETLFWPANSLLSMTPFEPYKAGSLQKPILDKEFF